MQVRAGREKNTSNRGVAHPLLAEEEAVDLAVETGKQVVYAAAPGWVEFGTLFFNGFDDFCERWRAQREYFGFAAHPGHLFVADVCFVRQIRGCPTEALQKRHKGCG